MWWWCVGHDGHRLCGDTHRPEYLPKRRDGAGGRVEYAGDRTPGACRSGDGPSLAAWAGPTLSRCDALFLPQPTPARVPLDELWTCIHKKEGHLTPREKLAEVYGDAWGWMAFSPVDQVVLAWVVGKRTLR